MEINGSLLQVLLAKVYRKYYLNLHLKWLHFFHYKVFNFLQTTFCYCSIIKSQAAKEYSHVRNTLCFKFAYPYTQPNLPVYFSLTYFIWPLNLSSVLVQSSIPFILKYPPNSSILHFQICFPT